ncbi:MAG: hypothetical protein GY767_08000 [Shimia sp.]|nr:hypothetical protein [Shimia sp.]
MLVASTEAARGVGIIWLAGTIAYIEAASGASDHHLTTGGGVKLYVHPESRGYDVTAFGAIGDGVTDDSGAIQAAINASATDGAHRVYFPAGTYACADDLYFCHDPVNNAGYPAPVGPQATLYGGRCIYEGAGRMTRRDYEQDHYSGSVVEFGAGKKAVFSIADTYRAWCKTVTNLSFVGSNGTIVSDTFAAAHTVYDRIFIGTDAAVADTPVFHISDDYLCRFSQIEIIGDKTLTTGRVGWGLHVEPSDTAGGSNVFDGIDCAYLDKGIVFGRPYDAAKTAFTDITKSNHLIACQGHYANIGIHIMHGVMGLTLTACWVEHCDIAPLKVSDSARGVTILDLTASIATGEIGERGLVVIGDDTGTAGIDAAYSVKVEGGHFFCTAGLAGVFVYDAAQDVSIERVNFTNGAGCAVGIEGGVGGEITLSGNQYFPETATSEIVAAYRVSTIAGTFGAPVYTDRAAYALELDYTPAPLAADLDCSTWRRPPRHVSLDTLSADRTLTLPDLAASGGRLAELEVIKPYAANDAVVDAGAGKTIRGAQTVIVDKGYTSVKIVHGGTGSNRWDVIAETVTPQAVFAAKTDNSGGTPAGQLVAVSGSGDDANINNNWATVAEQIEALRQALSAAGLLK